MQNRNVLSRPQALGLACAEVEAAGRALDAAMSWLEVAPRADKVGISVSLERALDRLRVARFELAAVEAQLGPPPSAASGAKGAALSELPS